MPSDLILITGVTGHLGFRTLILALQAGYRVRAAVRSQSKAETILSNPVFKTLNRSSQLSFIIVPDLTVSGAYDEAVKGVNHVIHIASPITNGQTAPEEFQEKLITPAVKGTIGMLESAQKTNTVSRIVITSSVVAQIPVADFMGRPDYVVEASTRTATPTGPFNNEFEAYAASKVTALNKTEKWIADRQPSFSVVHIHPSFIIGRDDLITRSQNVMTGTNAVPLRVVLGNDAPYPTPGLSVHNDDVARAHVLALDRTIQGNESFILSYNPEGTFDGTTWQNATDIVAREFPEAVAEGLLPNSGKIQTIPLRYDTRKTEEVFGFKHQSYVEQVKSVVGHYLELVAQE
ncbi:NAD(P)-binding protein [Glonium stellatum]|uniref:NAD(P)-binding protein n=1 Tax=Glonium stellatum TaxID=574774 RepID=A0A8E2EXX0_9PEZI|nr:NAD(P)-binding protein [Glonium stellatum]